MYVFVQGESTERAWSFFSDAPVSPSLTHSHWRSPSKTSPPLVTEPLPWNKRGAACLPQGHTDSCYRKHKCHFFPPPFWLCTCCRCTVFSFYISTYLFKLFSLIFWFPFCNRFSISIYNRSLHRPCSRFLPQLDFLLFVLLTFFNILPLSLFHHRLVFISFFFVF